MRPGHRPSDDLCGLTDHELRYRLCKRLNRQQAGGASLVDELILTSKVRADIVRVNTLMHGYELKSRLDTLARLPIQAVAYAATCDRCTIVTVDRHLESAIALLPDFWGVLVMRPGRYDEVLVEARLARQHDQLDRKVIAGMLRVDELLIALRSRAASTGELKSSRMRLAAILAEVASIDELRALVRKSLVVRAQALEAMTQRRADADYALFVRQRQQERAQQQGKLRHVHLRRSD